MTRSLKAALLALGTAALLCLAAPAAPAAALESEECVGPEVFGFCHLDVQIQGAPAEYKEPFLYGEADLQAGSHPFALTTSLDANTRIDPELGLLPVKQPRSLRVELPPGLVGSPDAVQKCDAAHFSETLATAENKKGEAIDLGGVASIPNCPKSSAVGIVRARGSKSAGGTSITQLNTPVYNLVPPPGVILRLGFKVVLVGAVVVNVRLSESPPYNPIATVDDIPQLQVFYGSDVSLWSDPGSPAHDRDRGVCGASVEGGIGEGGDVGDSFGILCPGEASSLPFLTSPRACTGPLPTRFEALAWSGERAAGEVLSHDDLANPAGMRGCERLHLQPTIAARPTARSASSPSGLDFDLNVKDEGIGDVEGSAGSDVKAAEVTLPEGVTINPSQAEGLATCTEADFAREGSQTPFGAGCPAASKVGTVEVETPLLKGVTLRGSLFVATPDDPATAAPENPFDSLIALYMTVTEPQRGIYVGLAGRVAPDPDSGRLITTFGDPSAREPGLRSLPQLPFSHFHLHFREGGRSPLITPRTCGDYTTTARLTPWADPAAPVITTASFSIDHGVGGGPCPSGPAPFEPGFEAGSSSNHAGSYAPFAMRLTRRDGDQDLTKFSATLPLGLLARLAGVGRCPDAQIALAKSKSGRAELASPSCPAGSQIGTVKAGAGAGSQLTYVEGAIYLSGPYNGAPLSVVGVVPAVAGPFDVGTVVTRFALDIDPRSAEVTVDGERSDPIPHILAGIPLALRDIQAFVERPRFTLNPTSCAPQQVRARIWGGGEDVFSTLDDSPLSRAVGYQAAGCRGLGFAPRLALRLRGGTRRGAHPALRGVFRPRPAEANLERMVLRLPHSAFLEQAHIRTICTRVQYRAANCPRGAVYGHVTAYTPLLSEPLEGPAYLRSSNHNLPDLVFDLHSSIGVDFEAVARIDSRKGGIRASFAGLPDAPLSRVVVEMQGGKKGLIVNSTNLCAAKHRADARLAAHNNARRTLRPALRPSCRHKKAHRGHRRR